jgi:Zn-dependent protease with chaperone function
VSGLWLGVASLGLLVLPGLGRSVGRSLLPRVWARLSAVSLVAGFVGIVLALVLLAAPTVLDSAGVPALAAACTQMAGTLNPGGPLVGWTSALAAIVLSAAFVGALLRSRRTQLHAHVEPWLGRHHHQTEYELVVLPCPELVALSVPDPPQVIISEGLLAALPSDQLEAVLDHEAAHLAHRHSRYLLLLAGLRCALGWLPPVDRSAHALHVAVERWADHEACRRASGGRQAVHAALITVAHAAVAAPGLTTFSAVATLVERLEALQYPAPRARMLPRTVQAPALALGALAGLSIAAWLSQAHMMLAMARLCRL